MPLILALVFASVVVLVAGVALLPTPPAARKRLARLADGSRAVVSTPTGDESAAAGIVRGIYTGGLAALGKHLGADVQEL